MSAAGKTIVTVFIVYLVTGTLILWHAQKHKTINISLPGPVELMSLMLGAAALILTAVALIVALLAFIGYREFVGRAEAVARDEANRVAQNAVEPMVARLVEAYIAFLRQDRGQLADAGASGKEAGGLDAQTAALIRQKDRVGGDDKGGAA